jgi:hypothetical protein
MNYAAGIAILVHFLYEIGLGIVGLLGVSGVQYVSGTVGIILQGVATGVALIFWLLLGCTSGGSWIRSCCFNTNAGSRLASIVNARLLYLFGAVVLHSFSLLAWILYESKFVGVGDITPTMNGDAFVARADLHVLQVVVFFAMFGILMFDIRRNIKSSSTSSV